MTTRIGFQGFAEGADVVLSSDGASGTTGTGGWPAQAQASTLQRAQIILRRSELQVAPEGINFEVVVDGFDTPGPAGGGDVYDPQFHTLYYVWDFGDPGAVFTAPEHVPDAHKNANRGYGPLASHTYQRPDTYTVRCLVIEPSSGKSALASRDITIGDPEDLFAGDRTIFVSSDPTFARAPVGARTVATPFEAHSLQGSLQSSNPTAYYRIMYDREQDHLWHKTGGLKPRNNYKNIYWCYSPYEGVPGTETPGEIFCANQSFHTFFEDEMGRSSPGKKTDFVIDGLRLNGYFDVTTEIQGGPYAANYPGGQAFYSSRTNGAATYLLFNNVEASGFNTLVSTLALHQDGPDTLDVIFNNIQLDSWSNFGIFEVQQGFSAYTGCRIRQNPLALSGGPKGGLGHNVHGPIRIQYAGKCVMHSCDMFSRTGWFENSRGIHQPQPCVRWNQSGDSRGKLNMQGCALESAGRVFESGTDGVNVPGVTPNNIIVDKTALIGGAFSLDAIVTEHPGMTVRNCLVAYGGDRTLYGAQGEAAFVRLDARLDDPVYLSTPNKVYSNTFLNHHSDTQSNDGDASVPIFRLTNVVGSDFSDVTIHNNILHQPNIGTPDVPFGPLGVAPLFNPRYDDYRQFNILTDALTLAADVPHGSTLFVSYTDFRGSRVETDFLVRTTPKRTHQFILAGVPQTASYAFDATGVTVTNNSGSIWTTGTEFRLSPASTAVEVLPEYATPDDIAWEAVPQTGSPAIGAALSGLSALDDFYGYARPQYPSIGAFEAPS